ncbi:hypothetical protein SKAU_G00078290 [Synaphobranchus kaupii]|uniref:Gypsy retrotransposon integrase-like protein 1 n=1 Tax=Synaphobranchus kaupii TaxID=118154 RepID=A0A9Q1J585_SYNKA|nr:hypothetical protein SKAU_G00078290 [Synaphobranchus kaupii]
MPDRETRQKAQPLEKRLLRDWGRLQLRAGIIRREVREHHTGLPRTQVVVPTAWTRQLWEQYHTATGYMSAYRIEEALRRSFFWPRLSEDLKEWVASCPHCVQGKARPEAKAPLLSIHQSRTPRLKGQKGEQDNSRQTWNQVEAH